VNVIWAVAVRAPPRFCIIDDTPTARVIGFCTPLRHGQVRTAGPQEILKGHRVHRSQTVHRLGEPTRRQHAAAEIAGGLLADPQLTHIARTP
jgi:hypothetical protein